MREFYKTVGLLVCILILYVIFDFIQFYIFRGVDLHLNPWVGYFLPKLLFLFALACGITVYKTLDNEDKRPVQQLRKRRDAAARDFIHYKGDVISELEICLEDAFKEGWDVRDFSLWTPVEEALPDFDKAVLVQSTEDGMFFNHRTNDPHVLTDQDKWCELGLSKIIAWMDVPEYKR